MSSIRLKTSDLFRSVTLKIEGGFKMNWDRLANEVELVYGGYVDRDEEFFICPECDEPIYK